MGARSRRTMAQGADEPRRERPSGAAGARRGAGWRAVNLEREVKLTVGPLFHLAGPVRGPRRLLRRRRGRPAVRHQLLRHAGPPAGSLGMLAARTGPARAGPSSSPPRPSPTRWRARSITSRRVRAVRRLRRSTWSGDTCGRNRCRSPCGLQTVRRTTRLLDAEAKPAAEVVDDEVSVLDGRRVVARFRELEVELTQDADEAIIDPVIKRLVAEGAQRAEPALPKYVRALMPLAAEPPEVEQIGKRPKTVEAMIRTALSASVVRLDPTRRRGPARQRPGRRAPGAGGDPAAPLGPPDVPNVAGADMGRPAPGRTALARRRARSRPRSRRARRAVAGARLDASRRGRGARCASCSIGCAPNATKHARPCCRPCERTGTPCCSIVSSRPPRRPRSSTTWRPRPPST